ncbi:protein tincar-like [Palaemon carinicauda]|uniref:protein tincar-like n=1 Tax=Palaemon carinicauda TaxID=392227 RepID=UPI0035B5C91D
MDPASSPDKHRINTSGVNKRVSKGGVDWSSGRFLYQTMSRANMPNTSSDHSKSTTTSSSRVKRTPSSISSGSQQKGRRPGHHHKQNGRRCCSQYHLNSVWSLWYCLVTLGFMGYLVFNGVKRFILYASLPWPEDQQPYIELNAYVGLVGASVVLLALLLVTSAVKVGNLANDGFKLGASLSTCSRDPPPVLEAAKGVIRNLWLHGVPTAPFLHLVAAFCLLLPRTVMDATLISAGFLPRDFGSIMSDLL